MEAADSRFKRAGHSHDQLSLSGIGAWRDVVAVAAGSYHTVGVTAGGRVVASGSTEFGQCEVGG